jgi:hypothetical protein
MMDRVSRRSRIAAAAALFRPKGAPSSPAAPLVPPAARPTLSLKLKASIASPVMGPAGPPAGARTGKTQAAAATVAAEAPRPSASLPAVSVTVPKAAPTAAKRYSLTELRRMVEWMRETWPAAFAEPLRPLALGAGALIIRARPPERSHKDIGAVLRFYTSSDSYLAALACEGSRRVGLDGTDAGEVEEGHREHAAKRLAERRAKRRGGQSP